MTLAGDAIAPRSEAELADIVERVGRVPSRYREFRRSRVQARWHHNIDGELLDVLVALGLPVTGAGDAQRFDELDLANVSLALRLPSARMLVMRSWRGALEAAGEQRPTRYSLTIKPRCPGSGHAGACRMALAPEVVRAAGAGNGRVDGDDFHVRRDVLGHAVLLPEPMRAVTDLVTPLAFHLLPFELRADLGFLRDTGLADCVLTARYLVAEARVRGLEARFSYGIFLAAPFSIDHCWAEFRVNTQWVPVDPHLLNTLTRLGLLSADRWPPYRSLSDAAWRIHEDDIPLMTDGNARALLSLPTRRISAPAAGPPPAGGHGGGLADRTPG